MPPSYGRSHAKSNICSIFVAARALTANARSRTFVPERAFPNTCPPTVAARSIHDRRRGCTTAASAPVAAPPGPPSGAATLPAAPARSSPLVVAGAAQRRRARPAQECPDRSRRRPCLRRRGRDGTRLRARCGPSRATACGRSPSASTATSTLARYVEALDRPQRRHGHQRRSGRPPALTEDGHYPRPVHCPVCHADDTKVVDSRLAEEGAAVRRRRHCLSCAHRFTTFERVDEVPLVVVKSDGRTRAVRPGARSSPASRPRPRAATSTPAVVEQIAESIEDGVRLQGSEVTSAQIGLAVLDRLRTHRRGRLPALRQRVQELRRRRRLPPRDRAAHQGRPPTG